MMRYPTVEIPVDTFLLHGFAMRHGKAGRRSILRLAETLPPDIVSEHGARTTRTDTPRHVADVDGQQSRAV